MDKLLRFVSYLHNLLLCFSLNNFPFKLANTFKGVYLVSWALFVLYFAIDRPIYNTDIVGYVASVYELIGLSGDALKDAVYDDVKNAAPHIYSHYAGTKLYEDPSALQQQTPFFKIRYVYVWITYALGQLTGSFSQATVLISAVSGFLIVLISGILFWNAGSGIAFLFVPPAIILGSTLTLSRITTVDALAALVAVFLCALILTKRHITTAFLIALLPLFRTDYIIFALAICVILFLRGRSRLAVLSIFFALLTYFAVNHFAENYGYAVIFNYTFIDQWNPYPLTMPISDNFFDYVKAYIRGVWELINKPHIFFYPIIYTTVLVFLLYNRYQNRFFTIYLACLFFAVAHFLLFPFGLFRHYFMILWASTMYLAEAFALYQHQARETSKALVKKEHKETSILQRRFD